MKKLLTIGFVLLSIFGLTMSAYAVPINYTFSGIGAGTFAEKKFKNYFEITVSGDTKNVIGNGDGDFISYDLNSTVYVDTFGTGDVKSLVDVILSQKKSTVILSSSKL